MQRAAKVAESGQKFCYWWEKLCNRKNKLIDRSIEDEEKAVINNQGKQREVNTQIEIQRDPAELW